MSPPISPSADCPDFKLWRRGYGVNEHTEITCNCVKNLASQLVANGHQPDTATVYRKLADLDGLTSAGLWLVMHMTYANRVDISGSTRRLPLPDRTIRLALRAVPMVYSRDLMVSTKYQSALAS